MTDTSKLPLFATRMNLQIVNQKITAMLRGHRLLKLKADALTQQFLKTEEKYKTLDKNIMYLFKQAYLALNKAQFLGANIDLFIKSSKKYPAYLKTQKTIVSGLTLMHFSIETNYNLEEIHGRGGFTFYDARVKFKKLLELLVEICSIKNTYFLLKKTLDATNRRVNSLEVLIIPRLLSTKKFISTELDEQEREEFYRLKKIQELNK